MEESVLSFRNREDMVLKLEYNSFFGQHVERMLFVYVDIH